METATAAVPTTGPEEDDNLDAMTIAEPEMEIEVQGSEAEPEHPDDIPDFEEYPQGVSNETLEERQPVLLPGNTPFVDPKLQIARSAMQPVFYLDSRVGKLRRCSSSSLCIHGVQFVSDYVQDLAFYHSMIEFTLQNVAGTIQHWGTLRCIGKMACRSLRN